MRAPLINRDSVANAQVSVVAEHREPLSVHTVEHALGIRDGHTIEIKFYPLPRLENSQPAANPLAFLIKVSDGTA